jgi:hypothetical protein
MKKLLLLAMTLMSFQTFAVEICQKSTAAGTNSIILSTWGKHAIISMNFCTYTTTGYERCSYHEAAYYIEYSQPRRAGGYYTLVKVDGGTGPDKLTLEKNISHICSPRWCDDYLDVKSHYLVKNEAGSTIFTCSK